MNFTSSPEYLYAVPSQSWRNVVSDAFRSSSLITAVPVIFVLYLLLNSRARKLNKIPTVGGPSAPILSFLGAFNVLFHGADIIQEGYNKYKGGVFKYATLTGWEVIVSGPRLINELCKSEDELSFMDYIHDRLQDYYTMGPSIHQSSYHVDVVRRQFTRNLDKIYPALHDEMVSALEDNIRLEGEDWKSIDVHEFLLEVVCRTSNRTFVGLSKCRDVDFLELNKSFTMEVMKCAAVINLFPKFMAPLVGRVFTTTKNIKRGEKHLAPLIVERLDLFQKHGRDQWEDKPVDILQFLIESAEGEELSISALSLRILVLNLAAIHTTILNFSHTLLYLAAYPEFVGPLREEVDSVIQKEGWTRAAPAKMHKIDSFLREAQRVAGMGALGLSRLSVKDFTFSDGTEVPAGVHISAAMRPTHLDPNTYDDPTTFNPWRFSDMTTFGEDGNHQMVNTSVNHMAFGHGKHSCPGRFFAASLLKTMLAHIIATYDVKMEMEGVVPPGVWIGTTYLPNRKAHVLFRKRQS